MNFFQRLSKRIRRNKTKNNKVKEGGLLMYKNGFPVIITDNIRHRYSALHSQGWRTKQQLEKAGNEICFHNITRSDHGQKIKVDIVRLVNNKANMATI